MPHFCFYLSYYNFHYSEIGLLLMSQEIKGSNVLSHKLMEKVDEKYHSHIPINLWLCILLGVLINNQK